MTEFEFEERSSSLVRLVRNDPDSLLQILLAVSTGQSRKRIVGSPAYPIASPTTDLPKRVALFKEMLLMDSRSAPFIMAKMFAAAVDLDWRKTYGQFFTPYDVARTVIHDLAIREGDMVLDAGSGTGSFAVAILDQFGSSTRTQYLGVEMDPILTLCGAIALEYLQAPPNWKILYRNFLRVDENVLFRIGFRSVDAIVANPPFIRSNRIADRQTFLPKLEQRFGFSVPGYSGSHSFFLAHATTLIDPNGKIGFLFPIGMSEVGYGAKLLSHISTRFEYSQKQVSPELKLFVFRKGQNHNTIHSSHKPDELLLESFADVHRGISTGANSFFVLSENEAKALRLPSKNLIPVLPTKSRIEGQTYSREKWETQLLDGKACLLLVIDGLIALDDLPVSIRNYLRMGERRTIPDLWTCRSRKPWYAIRKSDPPDLIFTYISHNPRFVYNSAKVDILTNVLGLYLKKELLLDDSHKAKLAGLLTEDIRCWMKDGSHGRQYAGGLVKFEPGDLRKMPLQKETTRLLQGTRIYMSDFDHA